MHVCINKNEYYAEPKLQLLDSDRLIKSTRVNSNWKIRYKLETQSNFTVLLIEILITNCFYFSSESMGILSDDIVSYSRLRSKRITDKHSKRKIEKKTCLNFENKHHSTRLPLPTATRGCGGGRASSNITLRRACAWT